MSFLMKEDLLMLPMRMIHWALVMEMIIVMIITAAQVLATIIVTITTVVRAAE